MLVGKKVIWLLLFLIGCSPVVPEINTTTSYMKDVTFWVNGKKIVGMGVAPVADSYEIYIEYPQGKMDLLAIYNCHREKKLEKEGTKAKYTLKPNGIEKELACPIDIGIYDKKGRHGWGYLLFESPVTKLKGLLECNGDEIVTNGVSVCQAHIDTVQRLSFDSTIEVSSDCEYSIKDNSITYEMTKEFCYFSIKSGDQLHRHVSYGYETFIPRE